jgi:hypothetical protein
MAMGEMLIERRLITQSQLDDALEEQREKGGKLGEILVARGWIDRLTLASALSKQWGRVTAAPQPVARPAEPTVELDSTIAAQREEIAALKAKVAELERMVAWFKDLTAELTRTGSAAA